MHRLLVALHLVFDQDANCGLRRITRFLELTQLNKVVGVSYGTQYNFGQAVGEEMVRFGQREQRQLASQMPACQISVCEDETFHPKPCLVAIEPRSGFVLLEGARQARRGLSDDDHPFDQDTGAICEADEVQRRLEQRFDQIEKKIAEEAGLSESSRKRIAKARRVLPAMVVTIALFWRWVRECVLSLSLSAEQEVAFLEQLHLSPQRLQSLTVLANFFHHRPDGTTAAERFFAKAPSDLFEWLRAHVPLPARPAKPRRVV